MAGRGNSGDSLDRIVAYSVAAFLLLLGALIGVFFKGTSAKPEVKYGTPISRSW